MAFGWLKLRGDRAISRLIRKDRHYLETTARRFLETYLNADESAKARFYRGIEAAVQNCRVAAGIVNPSPDLEDGQIAMAISNAATTLFLRATQSQTDEEFGRDAYAAIAIAYRRAAGIYTDDRDMRELGTAAVHLLTIATSYHNSQGIDELAPTDAA